MNVTCPSCGADMLLSHEDSRRALARLAELSIPNAKRVVQYLRLFKPATRAMSATRFVGLLEQLLPDLQRHAITHNGRDWDADADTWSLAIERVLERRDNGKLTLPLKSHGYLYEVIVGLADKAEAAAESAREAQRRDRRESCPTQTEVQQLAAVLERAGAEPVTAPIYTGPSRHALRLRAENEARRQARENPPTGDLDA